MHKPRFLLLVLFLLIATQLFAQTQQVLNVNWKFRQSDEKVWLPAQVPGTVHTDLLRNKKIPDPFLGDNEKDVQWVEKKDWVYETTFQAGKALLDHKHIELSFEGLDTYADVFVNGKPVLKADNMFRGWLVDVKQHLKPGANTLRVYFHSPVNFVMPQYNASAIKYPADNEQSPIKTSIFSRKAPYHYGWDWSPRLVTAGIWRPVKLLAWNDAKILNTRIVQSSLADSKAEMLAEVEIESSVSGDATLKISNPRGEFTAAALKKKLVRGKQTVSIPFTIKNPKRWWPNGLGDQKLYDVSISLKTAKDQTSAIEKTGLRTIEVVNKPDSIGESFYLKVNGVPVFMKGVNYVPADNFLPRVNKAKYADLFNSMEDANFNMVRVWGGGVYEDNEFYRLADEKGILVWQDFIFACTMYPSDAKFLESVKQEAEYNIKRLRNHASLALWCGNNEIAVGWKNWGWQKSYNYSTQDSLELINGYKKLFDEVLPQAVSSADPGRFYFPSSPISNWGRLSDFKKGDNHYWGVWHGEKPFESYKEYIPRFMSEYGFQSFPSMATIGKFAKPDELDINSDVMKAHQKSYKGNGLIKKYMDWYYRPPKDFESFVYLSQVLQAEGIKMAVEAERAAMPFCMGTLYWQLNDCWPGPSWSSIDYFGNWKALHYFMKKAYEPLLILPEVENQKLHIKVVSDHLTAKKAEIRLNLVDLEGDVKWEIKHPIDIKPNSSSVYLSEPMQSFGDFDKTKYVLAAGLWENEKLVSENLLYFVPVKDLQLSKPTIRYTLAKAGNKTVFKFTTDRLAKNVYLSVKGNEQLRFSDNYFDLIPGREKTISLNSVADAKSFVSNLVIKTLDSTY